MVPLWLCTGCSAPCGLQCAAQAGAVPLGSAASWHCYFHKKSLAGIMAVASGKTICCDDQEQHCCKASALTSLVP